MNWKMSRLAYVGILTSAAAIASHSAVHASQLTSTINDNYIGGNTSMDGSSANQDVIGDSTFYVSQAVATLDTTANTLRVRINTNFAGAASAAMSLMDRSFSRLQAIGPVMLQGHRLTQLIRIIPLNGPTHSLRATRQIKRPETSQMLRAVCTLLGPTLDQ